jgi:hypothetical protein
MKSKYNIGDKILMKDINYFKQHYKQEFKDKIEWTTEISKMASRVFTIGYVQHIKSSDNVIIYATESRYFYIENDFILLSDFKFRKLNKIL